MTANEFGKKLGIGVRVAGRIAQQRAEEKARAQLQSQGATQSQTLTQSPTQAQPPPTSHAQPLGVVEPPANHPSAPTAPRLLPNAREIRELQQKSHKYTRAAGRGVGGFLRPFGRVGGILWLEVTGFFFGLFALYFAQDLWKTHLSYLAGPQHQRFLIAAALTLVFGYLSASAFWRAKRR